MNRRDFVRTAVVGSAAWAMSARRGAFAADSDALWRTFELTTRVDVSRSSGPVRVWVPVPLTIGTAYQRPSVNSHHVEGTGQSRLVNDRGRGFAYVDAQWPHGGSCVLTVVSRVQTRNIQVDLTQPRADAGKADSRFLLPSTYLPSDGIVRATAESITRHASGDLEKARAIYEWTVENTFRDPAVRGCGIGDIRGMLETGNLGGKCADLNALYVALAHAAGLPARDAYGVRVAKSNLGYKSLGLAADVASKAQHCRAEVFVDGIGWVPVDPADVRKVVLEEPPGNLDINAEPVRRARERLFGSWEMNWVAYNFEHDVVLRGRAGKPLPYFMYPQGESAATALDSLDPDAFKYTITTKEITS